ncbi:hypothetical protein EAW55_10705 [Legionella jordanis]|uniref:Uncharacterized protein n=1 Tax=Legionella jordanis TaxID=456 RepID=A0A0W0VC74_9GAMM|nr:hypothetical protein [Legionella jordanis]KTD17688.1 hypothetical protein Ljor_1994 [Legionella jordanis]RMX01560.1 hypothetical protein EAW55_10705 [Legionella jordanis]VEH11381.1 Uncharacterised protein [Legionella jordanis]
MSYLKKFKGLTQALIDTKLVEEKEPSLFYLDPTVGYKNQLFQLIKELENLLETHKISAKQAYFNLLNLCVSLQTTTEPQNFSSEYLESSLFNSGLALVLGDSSIELTTTHKVEKKELLFVHLYENAKKIIPEEIINQIRQRFFTEVNPISLSEANWLLAKQLFDHLHSIQDAKLLEKTQLSILGYLRGISHQHTIREEWLNIASAIHPLPVTDYIFFKMIERGNDAIASTLDESLNPEGPSRSQQTLIDPIQKFLAQTNHLCRVEIEYNSEQHLTHTQLFPSQNLPFNAEQFATEICKLGKSLTSVERNQLKEFVWDMVKLIQEAQSLQAELVLLQKTRSRQEPITYTKVQQHHEEIKRDLQRRALSLKANADNLKSKMIDMAEIFNQIEDRMSWEKIIGIGTMIIGGIIALAGVAMLFIPPLGGALAVVGTVSLMSGAALAGIGAWGFFKAPKLSERTLDDAKAIADHYQNLGTSACRQIRDFIPGSDKQDDLTMGTNALLTF